MNRIEVLRTIIDEVLLNMKDVEERRHGYVHLYGVAQACALIALKRGQDVELATMTGMLHDIYSYANMDMKDHAHKGAILAREIMASLRITNDDETEMICNAIYTHSDKKTVHSEFNEVLKDADVFQHCLYNPVIEIQSPERKNRFEALKREFGIA
ncbi:MAG: HD domain-containing protein [Dehalococcoidales bacterium]|nr:MAG: HD domain-containing protein [Dehalococcoidales bacterium]